MYLIILAISLVKHKNKKNAIRKNKMITFDALIIREKHIGERNRIITVLAKDHGVIDIFCRGGMKLTSKNFSATQLFSYSTLCVEVKVNAKGERLYYLNSSQTKNLFYNIRLDLINACLASYISELLCYCGTAEKDFGEILRLTLNTYYSLDTNRQPPELLKSIFEIRLLCEIGFRPNLLGCNKCLKYEADHMHFNIMTGKILCDNCCEDSDNGFDFVFDKGMFYILRYIMLTDYDRLFSFKVSDKAQKLLTAFSESFVSYHIKPKFDTRDFYRQMAH